MEMEEEVDILSQQKEMPPAVSAVLDSTIELKKVVFSPHPASSFTLMHLSSTSFIHTSLCILFFTVFMKYTSKGVAALCHMSPKQSLALDA